MKEEILKIQKDLSISNIGMAKIMNISAQTYANKKVGKNNTFSNADYAVLILFLKNYVKEL